MYPENYRYSKEHEWVNVEGDVASIGITDFAQKQLGDIVYVELPAVGDTFESHDEMGSLESVKAVAEIFIPCSGEVLEINASLEDAPELVNSSPYSEGWLIKMRLADTSQLGELMDAAAYAAFVSEQE